MFFGFKPLQNFFSLRYNNDYEALNSDYVRNLAKKDDEFKKAVDVELEGFKANGFSTEKQNEKNQVFDESLNLDFYDEF